MRKFTLPLKLVLLALTFPLFSHAQYFWDFGGSVGASNYLGDIGGNELTRRDFVSDMKMQETRTAASGYARYKITPSISLKGDLQWARIKGDDKLSSNPARNARNLNFRNDIISLSAEAQYVFYQVNDLGHTYRYKDKFSAYVGAGVGLAYHNPKASYNGDWVSLRPLETEGHRYTKVTAVIPVSGGFYFTFNKHYRIGWDLTWNTTFTDYLDDVSTRYADPRTLSPLAAALANRTDELPDVAPAFAENFTPGSKRGDSSHNDSYLTSTVEFGYVMRGQSNPRRKMHDWTHPGGPGKLDNRPIHYHHGHRVIRPVW